MAPQAMSYPARAPDYLAQYRLVPGLLHRPYSPDAGGEVPAFLPCRDELGSSVEHAGELAVIDGEVAAALAVASEVWRDRVMLWARRSGFAAAPWRAVILTASERARSETVG